MVAEIITVEIADGPLAKTRLNLKEKVENIFAARLFELDLNMIIVASLKGDVYVP